MLRSVGACADGGAVASAGGIVVSGCAIGALESINTEMDGSP